MKQTIALKFNLPLLAALVGLAGFAQAPLSADVVFSSFGLGDTYDIFNGTDIEGPGGGAPQALAEQFLTSASYYLESIDLALSSTLPDPDLRVELYDDNAGVPGNLLEQSQVNSFSNGIVSATFGGNLVMTGGNNYWVGVFAEGSDLFSWHDSLAPGFAWQALTIDEGTTWASFSTDPFPGSAYRINGTPVGPPDVSLIAPGEAWRYFPGLAEPSVGIDWSTTTFDDSAWSFDFEGFGYDDDPITQAGLLGNVSTVLSGMRDNGVNADAHTSLYLRREFSIADPAELSELVLQLDYDDSFIAYINGVEVARSDFGTVGVPEPFDALGNVHESTNGSSSLSLERFVIDLVEEFPGLLTAGSANVLAIQGLNSALDDDDFVLSQISFGANYFTPPLTADFDNDNDVDAADLTTWEGALGETSAGDTDNDNDTDGLDFLNWQLEFTGPVTPLIATVPEPSSAIYLVVAAHLFLASRRWRDPGQHNLILLNPALRIGPGPPPETPFSLPANVSGGDSLAAQGSIG